MRGEVNLKQICKRISDSCTLTEADVMACISQLNFQVMDLVAQGYKVDLDDLGSLSKLVCVQTLNHWHHT